jgi:hypothetical protein
MLWLKQKVSINFTDGLTDDVYFLELEWDKVTHQLLFYLGIDVSGDLILRSFIEANMKSQTYMYPFIRDFAKTGFLPHKLLG